MKATPAQCYRCHTISRNPGPFWNVDWIAGVALGAVCPGCQTAEEHIEAEVNDISASPLQVVHLVTDDNRAKYIYSLLDTYPTAGIMRAKAYRLGQYRPDVRDTVVDLMLKLADAQERGEL